MYSQVFHRSAEINPFIYILCSSICRKHSVVVFIYPSMDMWIDNVKHLRYSWHFYWRSLRFPSAFWFMNFSNIVQMKIKSSKSILHIHIQCKNQTIFQMDTVISVTAYMYVYCAVFDNNLSQYCGMESIWVLFRYQIL